MYSFLSLTLSALLIFNVRAQCPNQPNSAVVGLKVQYDATPDETLLQVRTYSGSITTTNLTLNALSEANAYKEANVCLGRKTLSEVVISDSGRNGFFGSGYAAVSVNDRLLATVSDFGEQASYMFYADTATCNDDQIPFVLDIKYDSTPASTTWALTEKDTGLVLLTSSNVGNVNYLSNKFLTVTQCVSVDNAVYQFTITNDDGFSGFYRIFADYDLIKVGETFTGSQTQEFSLDGSTTPVPITISPTAAPVPIDPNSCVDNFRAKFLGEDEDGNPKQQPCVWLEPESRAELKEKYCKNADAQEACPHTCGVCEDDCVDGSSKFCYAERCGYNCHYIRVRLTSNYDKFFPELCVDSAAETCKKTCLQCSA